MQRRILIMDDDANIRRLTSDLLNSCGYVTRCCERPAEVMTRLREFNPDLVLMDMNMSILGGCYVADLIKKHVNYGNTKIVSFSTINEEVQQLLVDRGQVDGYFRKSGTLDGLTDVIDGILNDPLQSSDVVL